MIKIEYSGNFVLMYRNIIKTKAEFKEEILQRIKWFKKNPGDTRLDNHGLKRKMKGKYAFSITDDIRVVYEIVGKNTVRFLAIGPHIEVYPRETRIKK